MVCLPEPVCMQMLQSSLSTLEPSWEWVVSLMDVAEGQLQKGSQFDTQVSVVDICVTRAHNYCISSGSYTPLG